MGGIRVRGNANVGDKVTYFDIANQDGAVWEVVATAVAGPSQYAIRDLNSDRTTESDLRQHGWTFASESDLDYAAWAAEQKREEAQRITVTVPAKHALDWHGRCAVDGSFHAEIVKSNSRHVTLELSLPAIRDLVADAEHYVKVMHGEFTDGVDYRPAARRVLDSLANQGYGYDDVFPGA